MSPLVLPPGHFSAYLFDCDGTLADTMPLHLKAWNHALEPHGCTFEEAFFYQLAGTPTVRVVDILNEKYGLNMCVSEISKTRERYYEDHIHTIEPIWEVLDFVYSGFQNIPMAVVSGSPRASVIRTLTQLQILKHFDLILGSEDYQHGKPHPECFLKAAKGLGVQPETCLVFEDADLGIQSAIAAQMKWVRVYGAKTS